MNRGILGTGFLYSQLQVEEAAPRALRCSLVLTLAAPAKYLTENA